LSGEAFCRERSKLRVDDDGERPDDCEHALELRGCGANWQRHCNAAGGHRREVERDKVRSIEHQHGDALPTAQAGPAQSRSELGHAQRKLTVCEAFLATHERRSIAPFSGGAQENVFGSIHQGTAHCDPHWAICRAKFAGLTSTRRCAGCPTPIDRLGSLSGRKPKVNDGRTGCRLLSTMTGHGVD